MIAYTGIYGDIKSTIVDKTCLSCIGMDPVTVVKWNFDNNSPSFILENLTKGPVFIGYRSTVCAACDDMEPILKDIFNVEFGVKELFYDIVSYEETDVNFFHINLDSESSGQYYNSFFHYDVDNRKSVPMFVIITLNKNGDKTQPYYFTGYGKLGLEDDTFSQKKFFKEVMVEPAIQLYNSYKDDFYLR
jgi:hypothetical protein